MLPVIQRTTATRFLAGVSLLPSYGRSGSGGGGGTRSTGHSASELVLRPRLLERRQLRACGIDGATTLGNRSSGTFRRRVVDLRHEAEVGERDRVAEGVGSGLDRAKRVEALGDPMVIPGVDLALILPEFVLEMAQRSDIVEGWMSQAITCARPMPWRARADRRAAAVAADAPRRDIR